MKDIFHSVSEELEIRKTSFTSAPTTKPADRSNEVFLLSRRRRPLSVPWVETAASAAWRDWFDVSPAAGVGRGH
jgi:hypothetical protein